MRHHRKVFVAVLFVGLVMATVSFEQTFGQKPAAKPKADPVAELKARVTALEGATVEVSYGQCHLLPEVPNRYDPQNAENRIIRCGDGEVFNSWITGVNSPFSSVRINCCKIITKIVPKKP